jgi:hypothetical protein
MNLSMVEWWKNISIFYGVKTHPPAGGRECPFLNSQKEFFYKEVLGGVNN